MNRLSKIIGVSIGPKSLLLAEVAAKAGGAGGSASIQKLAEFAFPNNVSLATPKELGAALAIFLRDRGITSKDVIIGLPARRLLTRRKEVPPASPVAAASTLRLQAETEFTGEADTYAIDYAGVTSAAAATTVMLVATEQSAIDECNQLATAAGLKLRAITAASAALGRATSALPGGDGLVISLASGAAELAVQDGRSTAQLRHMALVNPGSPEAITSLVGEIRRTAAALHQNGSPLTVALWEDASNANGGIGGALQQRLNMPVTFPELRALAISETPTSAKDAIFAPAVAVALSALDPEGPPVDFLHSRLAPPKVRTNRRPMILAIVAGAVVVLAVVGAYLDVTFKQATLDNLNAQHSLRLPEVKVAQTAHDRLREARRWTVRKPIYTACLRDLTNLFPDQGNTIWISNLDLTQDSKGACAGTITGYASNETQVRDLINKLLAAKQFLNPHRENTTAPSGITRGPSDYLFVIKFDDYKPVEKK